MSRDKEETEDGITFSKLLEGVVSSLNQFKEPLFTKKELEKKGITSLFRNLPCTLNIRLETNDALETVVTSIRSELKHTRVETSTPESGDASRTEPKYLTYVEVGIEHSKTSLGKAFWESRLVRSLSIIAMVLVLLFGVFGVVKYMAGKSLRTETKTVVQHFDGTNLSQKIEIGTDRIWKRQE